jgi:hypothetical protein
MDLIISEDKSAQLLASLEHHCQQSSLNVVSAMHKNLVEDYHRRQKVILALGGWIENLKEQTARQLGHAGNHMQLGGGQLDEAIKDIRLGLERHSLAVPDELDLRAHAKAVVEYRVTIAHITKLDYRNASRAGF